MTTLEESGEEVSLSQMPLLLFIRGLLFFVFAVGLVAGLHYYLGLRLIRDAGVAGPWKWAAWAVVALLFFSIPGGFAAGRMKQGFFARAVQWASHLWLGGFAVLLVVVSSTDLVFWALGSRGGAAQAVTALAVAVPMLGWGYVTARGKAKVERITVPIRDLGAGFQGLRIVQVSDVHIGQTLGRAFLQRMVDQVNALEPDVVAVTGDLVDGFVRDLRDQMEPLAGLRAKRGVYYVTGNHEYYWGGASWEAEVRRLGLTVLHNEHRVLTEGGDQLVVAGVTDHDGGQFGEVHRSRPDIALAGAPEDAPRILLAHQPRSAKAAAAHRVDLQLSGHTHGGQIFPWMFFVRLQQPVISGLKRVAGVLVYTHRGTGYWGPPFRIGPKPEIAELTLVRT